MNPTDTNLFLSGTAELESVARDQAKEIFAMVSLQAPGHQPVSRGSVDIMAVIDRSGSMAGSKLAMVKQTLTFVVDQLKETDRLGIVIFDDTVETLLMLTNQDEDGKVRTRQAITSIAAGGSTNLCGGLVQGILHMRNRERVADVSSVLLLTDGQANVGLVGIDGIKKAMRDTGDLARKAIDGTAFGEPTAVFGAYPYAYNAVTPSPIPPPGFGFGYGAMLPPQPPQPQPYGFPAPHSFPQPYGAVNPVAFNPFPQAPPQPQPPVEEETSSSSEPLPCSVYTFGYGADHDPTLLKGIADSGEGVYYFIENNDKINESFADCLGGLLSVLAKDITITVTAANDSSVTKVHSKYRKEEVQAKQEYRISIDNIQSEEQKDLLFSVALPTVSELHSEFQFLNIKVEYTNVVSGERVVENLVLSVERPDVEPEGQQVNYMLDKQRNRIIAASAIEEAVKLAKEGRLEEAKALIQRTEEQITNSVSGSDPFCSDVLKDLQTCKVNLNDRYTWETKGAMYALNSVSAHYNQRCTNMSSPAQAAYQTPSRFDMLSKFN